MPSLEYVLMLVVVSLLASIQIPMDFRQRMLSRHTTLLATAALTLIIASSALNEGELKSAALAVGTTVLVTVFYLILRRLSPESLGLGDALLVIPLTLAVAFLAVERVLQWQLMAATTGTVHAVWVRIRTGGNHVPFGPHLLVAAWLMLVLSV